jgi:hypothetical protein
MKVTKQELVEMIKESIAKKLTENFASNPNSGSDKYDQAYVKLADMFETFKFEISQSGVLNEIATALVDDEQLELHYVEQTFEILCSDLEVDLSSSLETAIDKAYEGLKTDTTSELNQMRKELEI